MGGKLEDEVETAIRAETDQFRSVWVVDVSDDPQLGQEIAYSIVLILLFFLCYSLDRNDLTIG